MSLSDEFDIKNKIRFLEGKSTYTNSSTNITEENTLTREKLELMIEQLKQLIDSLPPDPLQEFAKNQGYDLDAGDVMVVPKAYAEAHGIELRYGVVFTEIFDCSIFLLRRANMPLI